MFRFSTILQLNWLLLLSFKVIVKWKENNRQRLKIAAKKALDLLSCPATTKIINTLVFFLEKQHISLLFEEE